MAVMVGVAVILAFALILALRLRPRIAEAPCVFEAGAVAPPTLRRGFVPCVSLAESLDPRYGALAELQLRALAVLQVAGGKGAALARLRPVYNELTRRYPELYDGATFHQWLRFYELAHLVAVSGNTVRLTKEGLRLLQDSSSERFAA